MKGLIFIGDLETEKMSTFARLTKYLKDQLQKKRFYVEIFNIANSEIPLFNTSLFKDPPLA